MKHAIAIILLFCGGCSTTVALDNPLTGLVVVNYQLAVDQKIARLNITHEKTRLSMTGLDDADRADITAAISSGVVQGLGEAMKAGLVP